MECPKCKDDRYDVSKGCRHCGFGMTSLLPAIPGLGKCPFCLAEVPAGARKCQHCSEWLDPRVRRKQKSDQLMRSGLNQFAAGCVLTFSGLILLAIGLIIFAAMSAAHIPPPQ